MGEEMDPSGELLVRREGAVLELTINRPDRGNSLTPALIARIGDSLVGARTDDAVRVVIITGSGPKFFCTGTDLTGVAPRPPIADQLGGPITHLSRGLEFFKPVVAAINGYALGGGLELALACDIRIASTTASFGLPEASIGTIPGAGGTQRLARQVPHAIAMKMLLTADRIGASDALRWGLVSDVVEPENLVSTAWALAERIAANAPLSVRAIKQAVQHGLDGSLAEGMRMERALFNLVAGTDDRAEGREAFTEKRPPRFVGT